MPNKLEITFEGSYIKVISDGKKDLEFAHRLWSGVVDLCTQHECYKVLGIANSTSPLEAVDGYDHARLFRSLGVDHKYRVAWVELNSEAIDVIYFVETVLQNRGLPGKIFTDVDNAIAWLLGEEKS